MSEKRKPMDPLNSALKDSLEKLEKEELVTFIMDISDLKRTLNDTKASVYLESKSSNYKSAFLTYGMLQILR